jgi:hypothetical protein
LSLHSVASPSLVSHGGVGLVRVRGYAREPAKSHESEVYDNGRARDLPCAQGSRIPCSDRGIHRGMHGVLQAGILCAITPISALFVAVLRLGTSSLDPVGDLTHGNLCDPCARPIWRLSSTSICETSSFALSFSRARA